jgi:alkanesulfonate monooxygenase SsuD/methylene tetrahydromethanopterin reductase-like flavin-dependent oxidoreductase (luciferase family)
MQLKLGIGVAAGPDPAPLASLAAGLEALGLDSIWSNDSPAGEGLSMLAEWAQASSILGLGVGVLALDRHTPETIAGQVHELALPIDRVRVGLGAGFSEHPLDTVRDGVAALRAFLPGANVVVAAMGPAMCRLAGEIGDGVLLNWMTPERATLAAELVHDGARQAGREPAAVTVYGYVRVAVGDEAAMRLTREAAFYTQLPHYARHFEAMGGDPSKVGIAVTSGEDLPEALAAYSALDVVVVRALSERTTDAAMEIARAAVSR